MVFFIYFLKLLLGKDSTYTKARWERAFSHIGILCDINNKFELPQVPFTRIEIQIFSYVKLLKFLSSFSTLPWLILLNAREISGQWDLICGPIFKVLWLEFKTPVNNMKRCLKVHLGEKKKEETSRK